ncbi:uncharacterized protein LOC136025763 [Artemia franciscana]|uniref:uncharacterized protein LOC136025763 n=1 Tax=Artemia franciscana TaxID=6661 RepID=UPI0032DB6CF2
MQYLVGFVGRKPTKSAFANVDTNHYIEGFVGRKLTKIVFANVDTMQCLLGFAGPVNFTQVSLELCGVDDKKYWYNITVQANNALDDNELFEGQWSRVTTQECIRGIYIGTTVIVVVCSVIGFAVIIIAFILGGSRLQKKYVNSMSAAKTAQFPWGSGSTSMFKKDAVDDKEMRENTSTASIKPLFDRINPDLTFSDVAMSERTAETHLEGELKDSQSSVTSSGISSGKDSEDKFIEVRLKSRQSMDSGAIFDSTSPLINAFNFQFAMQKPTSGDSTISSPLLQVLFSIIL